MAKQYQHILVPLDGSELAEKALDDAFSLAQINQAQITLLQVVSPIEHVLVTAGDHPVYVDEQWAMLKEQALSYLQQLCQRMDCGDEVKTKLVVEMGSPGETIIDYAHEQPVDLIVMATHGRTGLQRWVYGSVADKVLRGADVPVLLVRAHAQAEGQ